MAKGRTSPGMTATSFSIDQDMLSLLRELAKENERSVSAEIIFRLKKELRREGILKDGGKDQLFS